MLWSRCSPRTGHRDAADGEVTRGAASRPRVTGHYTPWRRSGGARLHLPAQTIGEDSATFSVTRLLGRGVRSTDTMAILTLLQNNICNADKNVHKVTGPEVQADKWCVQTLSVQIAVVPGCNSPDRSKNCNERLFTRLLTFLPRHCSAAAVCSASIFCSAGIRSQTSSYSTGDTDIFENHVRNQLGKMGFQF